MRSCVDGPRSARTLGVMSRSSRLRSCVRPVGRRSDPDPADPVQPVEQRGQIHRARRDLRARGHRTARRRTDAGHARGQGYRYRASLPRRARGTSSCAESQVRNRLSAGGRWIRTLGPPSAATPLRDRKSPLQASFPRNLGLRFAPKASSPSRRSSELSRVAGIMIKASTACMMIMSAICRRSGSPLF
jgi:hypothetical protein